LRRVKDKIVIVLHMRQTDIIVVNTFTKLKLTKPPASLLHNKRRRLRGD
jgi:hypothetical protein